MGRTLIQLIIETTISTACKNTVDYFFRMFENRTRRPVKKDGTPDMRYSVNKKRRKK